MNKKHSLLLGLYIVVGSAFVQSAHAFSSITNLGTLGGDGSRATSINEAGQVTGISSSARGEIRPFLWSRDSNGMIEVEDVSTASLITSDTAPATFANSLNNYGEVVGYVANTGEQAFLNDGDSVSLVGSVDNANVTSWRAADINDVGQVVGYGMVSNADGFRRYRPLLYSNGQLFNLGPLESDAGLLGGLNTWAYAINNSGQVVGTGETASGARHAFLYSGGAMLDLGTLGGKNSEATAINNHGHVVGHWDVDGSTTRAFLYRDGVMKDLGGLEGFRACVAQGLNDFGQVVGHARNAGETPRAMYYDGAMHDLNDFLPANSGWELHYAAAINNAGEIAGSGTYLGQPRAFVMTLGSTGN